MYSPYSNACLQIHKKILKLSISEDYSGHYAAHLASEPTIHGSIIGLYIICSKSLLMCEKTKANWFSHKDTGPAMCTFWVIHVLFPDVCGLVWNMSVVPERMYVILIVHFQIDFSDWIIVSESALGSQAFTVD